AIGLLAGRPDRERNHRQRPRNRLRRSDSTGVPVDWSERIHDWPRRDVLVQQTRERDLPAGATGTHRIRLVSRGVWAPRSQLQRAPATTMGVIFRFQPQLLMATVNTTFPPMGDERDLRRAPPARSLRR